MRDLIIDMADFGGVASAGDEVVLSAPAVRGSSVDPGRLITPQPRALELVDGVVTVPVEVGPLRVTLKPRGGVLPGTTFKTVVPEGEGPITLRMCLEGQFRYDPPVVSAVGEAAVRAELAASAAESSAGTAGAAEVLADGHAQSAGQSATLAGEHAVATGDDRRQTGLDRLATGEDVDETEMLAAASIAAASLVEGVVAEALGQYRGTGSPNGSVAAPVGSIYTDTAATNGAIRWIKTTGTGNTGWQVEYGDTGWRDVSGMLINGWEGNLFARRAGSLVSYRGRLLSASATNANAWDIPNGFRIGILRAGAGYDYGTAQVWTDENQPTIRRMGFYFDRFSVNGYQPGEDYVVGLSYTSMNSWPSVLPGVPTT